MVGCPIVTPLAAEPERVNSGSASRIDASSNEVDPTVRKNTVRVRLVLSAARSMEPPSIGAARAGVGALTVIFSVTAVLVVFSVSLHVPDRNLTWYVPTFGSKPEGRAKRNLFSISNPSGCVGVDAIVMDVPSGSISWNSAPASVMLVRLSFFSAPGANAMSIYGASFHSAIPISPPAGGVIVAATGLPVSETGRSVFMS